MDQADSTIQVGSSVEWTYNGLTTDATVLDIDPRKGVTIQYTNARGKLTRTRVPLRELSPANRDGTRMYRLDAGADTLKLLRSLLPDLGVQVKASYPHYLVVATNGTQLHTLVEALPDLTTRRLPGVWRDRQ